MWVLNGLHRALFGHNSAMETWDHERASLMSHSTFLHPAVLYLYPISTSISTLPFTCPSRRMAVLRAPGQRSISDSVSLGGKKICFLPCWWHEWLKMNIQGHIRNQSTVVKERKKAWNQNLKNNNNIDFLDKESVCQSVMSNSVQPHGL